MQLTQWVTDQGGFVSQKIELRHSDEKGNYLICRDVVAADEILIRIPKGLLLNLSTVADYPWCKNLDCSHSDNAPLQLALAAQSIEGPWAQILPKSFDSVPLSWTEEDRSLLPKYVQAHVNRQLQTVHIDASKASISDRNSSEFREFLHFWLCVNTRCLYYDLGLPRECNQTLAPLVDLFNHTTDQDQSVSVIIDDGNMVIKSTQVTEKNDELFLHYGGHDNAFLLAEYGFVPQNNPWNFLDLTEEISALLTEEGKLALKLLGYPNEYMIFDYGPSFGAELALAAIQEVGTSLSDFANGESDGSKFRDNSYHMLRRLLADAIARWSSLTKTHRAEVNTFYSENINLASRIISKIDADEL